MGRKSDGLAELVTALPVSGRSNASGANGHRSPAQGRKSQAGSKPEDTAAKGRAKAYDCLKCPGYCCSYPVIQIGKRDLARLARHFGLAIEVAERRFTRTAHGKPRVLRRKKDQHFGRICRFFDTEARRCTVYEARPAICRQFPGETRCGYYDFLTWERRHQEDPEFVATTQNDQWD